MGMYNKFILEGTDDVKDNVRNCISKMYGHMLKYLAIPNQSKTWVVSILNQYKNIKYAKKTVWLRFTDKDIAKIKTDAINKVYLVDNKPLQNYNQYFSTIDKWFPTPESFKDLNQIYNFLLAYSNSPEMKAYVTKKVDDFG
jgi:hypothetical protein